MKAWDTNLLVRHLLEDDARQVAVVRAQLDHVVRRGERIWLPQLTMIETFWVLGSVLDKRAALAVLEEVLADDRFAVEEASDMREAISRAKVRGDLPEHLLALSARRHGCTRTQTFDKAVARFPEFEVLS